MKSPTDSQPQSGQHQFLQDSSLFTRIPSEQRGQEPQIPLPKADQKILSPAKPTRVHLDLQGNLVINMTIPASELPPMTPENKLGQGGFGVVYKGIYNDKPVAIKQLNAGLSTDALQELKREAEIMFQLSLTSDHIVKVIKICMESPYALVMELMPQGSLYDLLRNGQELPWSVRFQIALDAAWGLKDLHAHKILHRDLKSPNILLGYSLRAKLADFGLAKVKDEINSQSLVATKGQAGTILWMAPELFDDEPSMTTASDIYSLGMVLWELVTRMLPYAKYPPKTVGTRIAMGKKEKIPDDPRVCSPELKAIIESCWETSPKKRPTAIQVMERLKPLVISQEQKMQTPVSSTAPESPKPAQGAGSNDEEMKKLLAEVMKLKLEKAEDERRRQELEKQVEEHARLKAEVEREREIKRQKAELKKSPSAPKPETPASLPPARQPEIKKPLTSEPVSPPSSVLSQSRFTIAPAPKPLMKPVDAKTLGQLLRFVAEGEQDKAEVMIQKDKNLLLHAGTVTDLSGREFKQITAFQYALWAMDWHMWKMIQKYLPEEQQREQFEVLETKGTSHGKHFSLQALIGALQVYVDNAEKWNYDKRAETHWCKVVGGAQRGVPAHVVNEYCREDRSFDPCPAFTEEKLPRIMTSKYFRGPGDWFTTKYNDKLCGEGFAFYRGYERGGVLWDGWVLGGMPESDWKSLQSLSKVRTQQLELLASHLKMSSYRPVFG